MRKRGEVYSYYTYDSNGQLVSINANGTEYYTIRNGQNDIIGLVDSTGTIVVNYTYSTTGEVISITGSLASTLGATNPYRYRGYRFDTETGYYYLLSRYYDPEMGRFINADGLIVSSETELGTNMYAYCENSPIIKSDENGYWVAAIDLFSLTISAGPLGLNISFTLAVDDHLNIGLFKNESYYHATGAVISLESGGKLLPKMDNIGQLSGSSVSLGVYGALGAKVTGGASLITDSNRDVFEQVNASAGIGLSIPGGGAFVQYGKTSSLFIIFRKPNPISGGMHW